MAQDQQTLECPASTWTQLTNANVTSITFQALQGDIYIRATLGTTPPTDEYGILYTRTFGQANRPITDFIKLSGANRVWAKAVRPTGREGGHAALVYVDHA